MSVVAPTPARIHAIAYRKSEQVTLLWSRFPRMVFADVNGMTECCLGRLSSAVLMTGMRDACWPPSNGDRPGQPLRTGLVSLVFSNREIDSMYLLTTVSHELYQALVAM
jgi:hypothetical protein